MTKRTIASNLFPFNHIQTMEEQILNKTKKWSQITLYLFMIIFLLINSKEAKGQNERWDKNNYIYSNYQYGFSWTLPNDVTWEKITGTEKHTIFKVVQPDTNITVFVNASKIETKEPIEADIWQYQEYIKNILKATEKITEQNTGLKTISSTFSKCTLCGQHAFKTTNLSSLKDDRYDEDLKIVTLSYLYYYKGYTFTVTIKAYKEIYDAASEYIKNIFRGYTIVRKY